MLEPQPFLLAGAHQRTIARHRHDRVCAGDGLGSLDVPGELIEDGVGEHVARVEVGAVMVADAGDELGDVQ